MSAAVTQNDSYMVTCEHGGNRIPPRYRALFIGYEALLQTHRGLDPGALTLARELAAALHAPLVASVTSRLLVDLNRSSGHPQLYSQPVRQAPEAVRRDILQRYYQPYRRRAQAEIEAAIALGQRVIHISSHSFTPVLDAVARNADIGLLYDPARRAEMALCRHWQAALAVRAPQLRVRRNYPYTGKSDGFCSYLRRRFPPENYLGIELEINQKHVSSGGAAWPRLRATVIVALLDIAR